MVVINPIKLGALLTAKVYTSPKFKGLRMKSDHMLVTFVRIDPGNTIRCSPLAWYDLQTCAEGGECRRSKPERY